MAFDARARSNRSVDLRGIGRVEVTDDLVDVHAQDRRMGEAGVGCDDVRVAGQARSQMRPDGIASREHDGVPHMSLPPPALPGAGSRGRWRYQPPSQPGTPSSPWVFVTRRTLPVWRDGAASGARAKRKRSELAAIRRSLKSRREAPPLSKPGARVSYRR